AQHHPARSAASRTKTGQSATMLCAAQATPARRTSNRTKPTTLHNHCAQRSTAYAQRRSQNMQEKCNFPANA
ncbi:hypothetical protein A2U01_0032224, partial [Trifolium medium]|nr:hypothetical protein [Trifolium medium]